MIPSSFHSFNKRTVEFPRKLPSNLFVGSYRFLSKGTVHRLGNILTIFVSPNEATHRQEFVLLFLLFLRMYSIRTEKIFVKKKKHIIQTLYKTWQKHYNMKILKLSL